MSAKSQYPCGSHTRDTTAGYSDMLFLISRNQLHFQLFTTGRIDNTARRVTLCLFPYTADHTACAWCNFLQLIFSCLINQVWVSKQCTTEYDPIHSFLINQLHCHGRIQHLAYHKDRHTADLADSCCLRNIDTLMLTVTWNDLIRALILCTATDFEVIDTAYETDEDGLTSATVNTTGKVGYDALTDEQKETVSDVAVLKESGIVLNYSATGELPVSIDMDALGKFIADNEDLISHLVYQTAEFTPEKYDGTVTMDFHFNANDVIDRLGGETKDIVVFEVMSKNAVADEEGSAPVIVASECDLDSEEQTVNLVPTVIGTTATDKSDGDHTLMAGKDAVITDRVTYEGLIPGKEYTLKATLMDKKTGEMLSINDQHVTAELKFTPNSQNGTIDIDLGKFDASSLDGHDLVVFEELYKQTEQGNEATEVLVAEHKDIDDEGQTVTVTTTPPGGFFGKTGGNDFFIVVSIAALAVLACGCAYYGIKNRRAAKAEDAAADEGGDTDNGDVSGDSEA